MSPADQTLNGVFVGCCGPVGLGDSCSEAVRLVDAKRRDQVGGVEIHEECVAFLLVGFWLR